jgi:glycosyltransferase involved in cell wall biosynthesis
MKKICFIANNNIGLGFSGGDRIFTEFLKNWCGSAKLLLIGSEEAIKISRDRGVKDVDIIQSDKRNENKNLFSFYSTMTYLIRRTRKGINVFRKDRNLINNLDYIYSVSDFYPDFIPAFYAKLKNKNIKWIAGYYLFAPAPFSKKSPYKGRDRLRGFFYWLMQRPTYFIAKRYADFIFVTSEPDVAKFITKKRKRDKIIIVQGGVDIVESEKYLHSPKVIPVEKRRYDACFVGRFHYQKGVLELIDIWKGVCKNKKDAKLAMIGDGLLECNVKEKINKYKLGSNIELLGFKDGQEKYEIFKQSKIIVHPATYDSGGMAAAEGMAWKLPGVSFGLEALKTYYPKGMVKTEIGNNEKFAENILELLDNKELYEKISTDAHNLIVETWDWKKRSSRIMESILNL